MKLPKWVAGAAALVVSLFLGVTLANAQNQDDRDHHDHDQGYHDRDHHDRDHDRDNNYRDHDRDRHEHNRFDDHDRDGARDWYHHHHDAFRVREGRYWHREWGPEIHEGFVFTPDMRRAIRPVPHDLLIRLGPPPPGYRYVLIGDRVCLIDQGYRVHDVLNFELNF